MIDAANKYGKKAQVDLINVSDKKARTKEVAKLGAHIIGVHTGLDQQAAGQTPFADLGMVASLNLGVDISVAGGVKAATTAQVRDAGATIIVAGAAIYGAADPAAVHRQANRIVVAPLERALLHQPDLPVGLQQRSGRSGGSEHGEGPERARGLWRRAVQHLVALQPQSPAARRRRCRTARRRAEIGRLGGVVVAAQSVASGQVGRADVRLPPQLDRQDDAGGAGGVELEAVGRQRQRRVDLVHAGLQVDVLDRTYL